MNKPIGGVASLLVTAMLVTAIITLAVKGGNMRDRLDTLEQHHAEVHTVEAP